MQDPTYQKAELTARNYYLTNNGQTLGQVVEIRYQIVSGTIYSIFFKGVSRIVQIDVWAQPWVESY